MDDSQVITELSTAVHELNKRASLQLASDARNKLLCTTVVPTEKVQSVLDAVTELMGPAVKPAGQSAWFKNWFDPFFKSVGGIQREQTLFRRELTAGLSLYCAFWPWASDPKRTSVRVGISCGDDARRKALTERISAPR